MYMYMGGGGGGGGGGNNDLHATEGRENAEGTTTGNRTYPLVHLSVVHALHDRSRQKADPRAL